METKTSQYQIPWRGIGVISSTVGIIVLLVVFYFVYSRLIEINVGLADVITNMDMRLEQNQTDFTTLQNNFSTIRQDSKQLRDDFNNQTRAMDEIRHSLLDNKNGWVIDEARYLVKLANDHLQFENNIPLAINM